MVEEHKERGQKPTLLLQVCCGPCASAVLERLKEDFEIHVFYDNPNIHDEPEYNRRRGALEKLLRACDPEGRIARSSSPYNPEPFFTAVAGLEDLGEGSARCEACIRLRLERTAEKAKNLGIDYFASTLTISPHKNALLINHLGEDIAEEKGIAHLPNDFKKKAGYQRSIELCRAWDIYRQDYCGCIFSKKESASQKERGGQNG